MANDDELLNICVCGHPQGVHGNPCYQPGCSCKVFVLARRLSMPNHFPALSEDDFVEDNDLTGVGPFEE